MLKAINPTEVDKHVEKLLQKMGTKVEPQQVPVQVEPYSKLLHCFPNVDEKVKRDGGSVHYGWSIFQSSILCEAERHAVWQSPEDNLIDVTPNEFDFEQIMFVSDNDFIYEGQLTDNIRVNITDNPLVDDYIYLCEIAHKAYSYAKRVDGQHISLPQIASDLIQQLNEQKFIYQRHIYKGGKTNTPCFCGKSKNYRNCHGKNFRRDAQAILSKVNAVIKANQ